MGSNEILSTFGLANSLAGFIVGPLVLALAVAFQNLVAARRVRIAVDRPGDGGPGHPRPAGLPDPDQEPQRLAGTARRHDRPGLACTSAGAGARALARGPGGTRGFVAALVIAGLRDPPARSGGADAVDDVAPLSLGILARRVGRDHRRGDERDGRP